MSQTLGLALAKAEECNDSINNQMHKHWERGRTLGVPGVGLQEAVQAGFPSKGNMWSAWNRERRG